MCRRGGAEGAGKQAPFAPVRDLSQEGWRGWDKERETGGNEDKRIVPDGNAREGKAGKTKMLAVLFSAGPEGDDVGVRLIV